MVDHSIYKITLQQSVIFRPQLPYGWVDIWDGIVGPGGRDEIPRFSHHLPNQPPSLPSFACPQSRGQTGIQLTAPLFPQYGRNSDMTWLWLNVEMVMGDTTVGRRCGVLWFIGVLAVANF